MSMGNVPIIGVILFFCFPSADFLRRGWAGDDAVGYALRSVAAPGNIAKRAAGEKDMQRGTR